ncbi:hypothetical protein D3C77_480730 [compost metagenome]
MRAAQQPLGHGDEVALEIAHGLKVGVRHPLGLLIDQGVQRQGGRNGGDPTRRPGGAGRQGVQGDPADHAVAPRPAPGAHLAVLGLAALQHVEGLAEQNLVDARVGLRQDVDDRQAAMHGLGPAVGLGPHQPLQRLFGQHHAAPLPQDQGRARRQQGQDIGQAAVSRRLRQIEPPRLGADPQGGVNSLGYSANLSLR